MWRAFWLAWTALVIMLTTMPWRNFKGHAHWASVRWIPFSDPISRFDVVTNILLFVPFGFLYLQSRSNRNRSTFACAVLYAAILSAAVELFQSFSHNRVASTTDLCSNVMGAAIGAALAVSRKTHPDQS